MTKSETQLKLDAAEIHILNLQRSLGQSEEKIKLMDERIQRYEVYTHYLESEMSRLRQDPAYKVKDLAFTSSDHINMIKIRDTLTGLVEKMSGLSDEISDLKQSRCHAPPLTRPTISESFAADAGHVDKISMPVLRAAGLKISGNEPTATGPPSRMSFSDKVRRFSNIDEPNL